MRLLQTMNFPGFSNPLDFGAVAPNFVTKLGASPSLGDLVSVFLNIVFLLSGIVAFLFFVWGAMQYLFAGGDKEKIARARARITWAIIGLIVILLAYTITQLIYEILTPAIRPGTTIPLGYKYETNNG